MQNIQIPKIPVQELFYLRQLTVSVFCITNIKANTSSLYIYDEGEEKKGQMKFIPCLMIIFSTVVT